VAPSSSEDATRAMRETQRSNVGHAQMGTFFGSRAPIFRAKIKGKHGKQPVSRKIYEKN